MKEVQEAASAAEGLKEAQLAASMVEGLMERLRAVDSKAVM